MGTRSYKTIIYIERNDMAESKAHLTSCIVLASYNGSRFIEEQLESIYRQTRTPDELIAVDDCSTDKSADIIKKFIDKNALSGKWRLETNSNNIGYINNFLKGCELSSSDVIFFSDQDDIWLPDKIDIMMKVMEARSDALAVACDSQVINEQKQRVNTLHTMLRSSNRGVYKVELSSQVSSMLSSGLTLAVRSSFMKEMNPIIRRHGLTYDSPVGLFSSARGGFYRVDKKLVMHRVHRSNASAPMYTLIERMKNPEKHIEGRKFQLKHLCALSAEWSEEIRYEELCVLNQEIERRNKAILAMENGEWHTTCAQLLCKTAMSNKYIELVNLIISINIKIKKLLARNQ